MQSRLVSTDSRGRRSGHSLEKHRREERTRAWRGNVAHLYYGTKTWSPSNVQRKLFSLLHVGEGRYLSAYGVLCGRVGLQRTNSVARMLCCTCTPSRHCAAAHCIKEKDNCPSRTTLHIIHEPSPLLTFQSRRWLCRCQTDFAPGWIR